MSKECALTAMMTCGIDTKACAEKLSKIDSPDAQADATRATELIVLTQNNTVEAEYSQC